MCTVHFSLSVLTVKMLLKSQQLSIAILKCRRTTDNINLSLKKKPCYKQQIIVDENTDSFNRTEDTVLSSSSLRSLEICTSLYITAVLINEADFH